MYYTSASVKSMMCKPSEMVSGVVEGEADEALFVNKARDGREEGECSNEWRLEEVCNVVGIERHK